jgi:DNA mismatch repair protein MutS2
MNEQAFNTLEYDALRALVRNGAHTPMGRELIDEVAPFEDPNALGKSLDAVSEAISLRQKGLRWSFSELADPSEALSLLNIEGASIQPLAMLELARLCEQSLAARAVILTQKADCPVLWELVDALPRDLHSLAARISSKILPSGELDDRASPELARIRHDITRLRSSITRSLESLMRRSEAAIQDELVTVRNDRFVIPVKADHRGRVSGVAHGFSSSGATVFVEPLETIDSNNELQSLRETEEREIARILFTLTEELRRELPAIVAAARSVAQLDFIGAKLAFQAKLNCVIPEINEQNELELVDARHPLLEANLRDASGEVVPVSFKLDTGHPVMIISGANAGGKTVVLKTAGLLSLMGLSGLPVPARSARIPFYESVLADIGDHQSLAANLSTFTSHVANISRMIEFCKSPALVLLDEVGTGTDPEEGSALGVAVVDNFRRSCGAHVLATTHYSGLKMYAANEDAVINASVEFDEKTLRPTYKLLVGLAGASSGIEIARRFGIPDTVVRAAIEHVGASTRDATEYLRRIKRDADEAESLRVALEEERVAVAEKYASLDGDAARRERERQITFENELLTAIAEFETRSRESNIEDRAERVKAEREAQKHAASLKREAHNAARVATTALPSSKSPASKGVRVVRDGRVVNRESETVASTDVEFRTAAPRAIKPGDQVRLKSFGSIGIVDEIKGDEAEVRVKSLRFRERLGNLELVETTKAAVETTRGSRLRSLAQNRSTEVHLRSDNDDARVELNLIGRTTDEAVDEADKFLDHAFLNGLQHIRIIHGHGTGALRKAIGTFLKDHPHVERVTQAPQDQGGSGATLVELKQ